MGTSVKYTFIKAADEKLSNDIIELYRAQGWWDKGDSLEKLSRIITGSAVFITAHENGILAGMARAIGDGTSDAYIQDVAVLKEKRGRGIGFELVRKTKEKLEELGYTWIGLIAQDGTFHFYEKNHFRVLQNASPMISENSHV